MPSEEIETPIWDHIEALRGALLKVLYIILASFLLTLFFYEPLMKLFVPKESGAPRIERVVYERVYNPTDQPIELPLRLNEERVDDKGAVSVEEARYRIEPGGWLEYRRMEAGQSLFLLNPIEGFLTAFKICFWLAVVGSSPFWVASLISFVRPGLRESEERAIGPFLGLSFLFMAAGVTLACLVTVPFANGYFREFNSGFGVNAWSLANYVDYTFLIVTGHAVLFEIAFLLLFLVHKGWISAESLVEKRRIMIVAAFVLGAVLTPPDVFTQCMMAIPLIAVYELAIVYAKRR